MCISWKKHIAALLLLCLPLLVAGCGGDGDGGGGSTVEVSGVASKGPIAGGVVAVHRLLENGTRGDQVGSGTTGADGSYAVAIPASVTGPVVVTVTGRPCTDCHMAGSATAPLIHQWGSVSASRVADVAGHKNYFDSTPGTDYTTCRNAACHGATLLGAFASGPACSTCHGSGNPLPAEN